jgi:DNA polymerase
LIKCRPELLADGEPQSRKPSTDELQAALPLLRQQIEIIQPRVLVALGAAAMVGLLGETQPMSRLRGRWHEFEGRPVMATYHPTYLVRNQALSEKRKVWEDMLLVIEKLGRSVSPKQRGYFLPKG